MSAFNTRRGKLLLLAILISLLLLWQPWGGLEPQLRGIKFDEDILESSRMVFDLSSSRIEIQTIPGSQENLVNSLLLALQMNLGADAHFLSYDPASRDAVFHVSRYLTMPLVQEAIVGLGTVKAVEIYVMDNIRESAVYSLKTRVDPYDLLDLNLRSFGKNSIIFEGVSIDSNSFRDLLGKQGKLEVIIDNELVLTNNQVSSTDPAVALEGAAYVPITLTTEGAEFLRTAVSGKTNRTIIIHLDRPSDAIIVFDNEVLKNDSEVNYDEASRAFYVSRQMGFVRSSFYLSVSAVPITLSNIPRSTLNYIDNQISSKTRVILLGAQTDFSTDVIQEISNKYRITPIPRREGEMVDEWIFRACGVESTPVVSQTMAAGGVTGGLTLPFIERDAQASIQKAQNFQKTITNSVAIPINIAYETTVGPSFGEGFAREIVIAGGFALLWMAALLYIAYSRFKIVLTIIAFVIIDAFLTLGATSALSLPFGMPALAGILFVIAIGINQYLIISNEMMKGIQPQEKVSVGWRASRALSMVYISIFAMVAVTTLMGALGFASIRMFSIVAAVGILLAMILTRPVFAKVIDSVLAGR